MTPLMWAAKKGHRSIVALLLCKGADPNLRNNVSHLVSGGVVLKVYAVHSMQAGRTAYDLAQEKGHSQVCQQIIVQE